jgi:hypothetical protein
VQLCGPWTLAATMELPRTLNVALSDPGAVADLTASLAEGAAAHAAELAKRVPGARLVVQFDEPALPAVLEGMVPTASGLSRLAPVEADTVRERLAQVLGSVRCATVVHCCAATVPFGIIRAAGADAVAFDLSQLRRGDYEGVAEAAESGMGLFVGALLPLEPDPESARPVRVITLWRRLGLPLATITEQAVVTPPCGLAGVSPARARQVLARCRETARMLPELIERETR